MTAITTATSGSDFYGHEAVPTPTAPSGTTSPTTSGTTTPTTGVTESVGSHSHQFRRLDVLLVVRGRSIQVLVRMAALCSEVMVPRRYDVSCGQFSTSVQRQDDAAGGEAGLRGENALASVRSALGVSTFPASAAIRLAPYYGSLRGGGNEVNVFDLTTGTRNPLWTSVSIPTVRLFMPVNGGECGPPRSRSCWHSSHLTAGSH